MPKVRVDDVNGIRVLRLSHPQKKNAVTRSMLNELVEALPSSHVEEKLATTSSNIRCVVLLGDEAGDAFSSGFDIDAIDDDERASGLDPIDKAASAIEACDVPVIAAIEGKMYGGAFELAMACDMRVMSRSSSCCMPPARLGLVYSVSGLQRFLRTLSPSKCHMLFLRAMRLSADKALAWGVVDDVVDDGTAYETALKMADEVAAGAPIAIRGMCAGIRALSSSNEVDLMQAARELSLCSADLQEGVRAFQEKRPPHFRGL